MNYVPKLFLLVLLSLAVGTPGQSTKDTDDVLIRALQDEMERSLTELQIDDEPPPYFLSYTVNETSMSVIQSILGGSADSNHSTNRNFSVNVRVGDRELDNTNFEGSGGGMFGLGGLLGGLFGGGSFPLTDSYDELRRVIWMNTDSAYKEAVSSLAAKKTALEQQPSLERANDFNEEEPFEYVSESEFTPIDIDRVTAFANELSSVLKGHPELQQTSTIVTYVTNKRTYIDSDGNFNRLESSLCTVRTQASAQAEDGAMVNDYLTVYANNCEELYNDIEELKQRHEQLIASVLEFKNAEHVRAYTGPVLITDEATGDFFSQVLGSRAGAVPLPVSESSGFGMMGMLQNPFMDKIEARVFPRFLSVVNDPTIREHDGVSLMGSYVVDSEGMPARRTELIKDGKLLTLLTTRAPTKELNKSTGSNRTGTPLPGNLFISSSEGMTEEELKQELLMLVEDSGNDYGIVIKRFSDIGSLALGAGFDGIVAVSQSMMGGGIPLLPTLHAYKVEKDGTEVAIRPLTVTSFSDSQLKDIVAVSDTVRVHNVSTPFSTSTLMSALFGSLGGLGGAFGSPGFLGVVAPDVLLEELSFQGGGTGHPRLPIVAHPASE
ncbi:MAG: hypothetical protein F4W92_02655 [Gammaproteobacteria bacterium]|nr:hypothetical protein [Gammaproteobacteria bacterium]